MSSNEISEFVRGYLASALWSSSGTLPDGTEVEALDDHYGVDDFAPSAVDQAVLDCGVFQQKNAHLLDGTPRSDDDHGYDFWLTRNRHGAGFWDRGLGEVGDLLTDAAQEFKQVDIYVGENGLLYFA